MIVNTSLKSDRRHMDSLNIFVEYKAFETSHNCLQVVIYIGVLLNSILCILNILKIAIPVCLSYSDVLYYNPLGIAYIYYVYIL